MHKGGPGRPWTVLAAEQEQDWRDTASRLPHKARTGPDKRLLSTTLNRQPGYRPGDS